MRIRGDNNGRRGSAAGTFVITLLLVIAVGVFAYSGWRLFHYYMAYKQGSDEYSELNEEYVKQTPSASAGQAAQNQGGSSASTEAAGTQEQSSREAVAAKASARQPISDLTLLEDPDMGKAGSDFFRYILEVASGRATCNEKNGYREIAIWKDGVTL